MAVFFYFWCMHKKICANAFSYFYCYGLVSRNFTLRTSSSILILIFSKWKTIINVIIIHKIQLLHNNHFFTSGLTTIIAKNVNVSKPNICTLLWWKALASCCNCIRKIKKCLKTHRFFFAELYFHARTYFYLLSLQTMYVYYAYPLPLSKNCRCNSFKSSALKATGYNKIHSLLLFKKETIFTASINNIQEKQVTFN